MLTREQRREARGKYTASPGYFDISLANGIRGESTVTAHTTLHRFTFPSNASALRPVISIELNDLRGSRMGEAAISLNPSSGRIAGNGTFGPSFGEGLYTLHFCADFETLGHRNATIWEDSAVINETERLWEYGMPGGAVVMFDVPKSKSATQVVVRMGLSFMNVTQACKNAESEIPDFNFEQAKSAAEQEWRKKLQAVEVHPSRVDMDLQSIFWSGIYRSMISPQDYTGENPLWNSTEPYFDSFYCIWDSFRAQHPLLTVVDPVEQSRMVRALIDIFKHEGKLPDCRMSLCKGYTQGGSNADVVLADAFIKNLTVGIDWELGYEAVVSDAEDEPSSWNNIGRGGLESWRTRGYIPVLDDDTLGYGLRTRTVSRTVEYAYNDFCIAEMAEKLGKSDDQTKYYKRAGNWRNLFKADQTSFIGGIDTGFKGFLQPR